MDIASKKQITVAAGFLVAFTLGGPRAMAQADPPAHAVWAEDIAVHVTPRYNEYGSSPSYIRWAGVDGAARYENRTMCNTFLTRVLQRAYGWTDADIRDWLGSSSPLAARWHDAIVAGDGFLRITAAFDIEIGDVLSMKYPEGSATSGHVMIAMSAATPRAATAPIVVGTVQYEIEVADSSSTGHGPLDTRRMDDGTWDSGAGIGVARLYADASGELVGYTWSTYASSVYYSLATRHMAVGRLNGGPGGV